MEMRRKEDGTRERGLLRIHGLICVVGCRLLLWPEGATDGGVVELERQPCGKAAKLRLLFKWLTVQRRGIAWAAVAAHTWLLISCRHEFV